MPEFPELGWNDPPVHVPPHMPEGHDQVIVEEVFDEPTVRSQESVVMQGSGPFDNSVNVADVNIEQPGAIIVYQPPLLQPAIQIGQVLTVFGPVLPPDMIWRRNFERLMPFMWMSEIPWSIHLKQWTQPIVLSKRSWEVSFSFSAMANKLVYHPSPLTRKFVPAKKPPVACALYFDAATDNSTLSADEGMSTMVESELASFSFSVAPLKRSARAKPKQVIVESEV